MKKIFLILLIIIGIIIIAMANPINVKKIDELKAKFLIPIISASSEEINVTITRGLTWDKKCNEGTCNLLVSIAPINYFNDSEYVPINRTIVSSDDLLYDYEVEKGIYEVYFKENPTHAETMKYVYNDSEFYFQPFSLNYRNALDQIQQINTIQSVTGSPIPYVWSEPVGTGHAEEHIEHNDSEIMNYPDAFGYGTNLTYRYANKLLKLKLIIDPNSIPAPESYITSQANVTIDIDFMISYSNDIDAYIDGELWDKHTTKRTKNKVLFKRGNETVHFLPVPILCEKPHWELNITTNVTLWTSDCTISEYLFKKQGNKLHVELKSNYSFFNNSDYVSPMEIDPSIEVSVTQSSDDADESSMIGVMDLVDDVLAFSSIMYGGGMMFRDVNIAQGTAIDSATLKLTGTNTCAGVTDQCQQTIYGEAIDDAPTFTTTASNISNRVKTGNSTYWGENTNFISNAEYQNYNLDVTNITQEIFDRAGWSSGNMSFIITCDTYGRAKSIGINAYDHASFPEPTLNITYTSIDTCIPPATNNNWNINCNDNCTKTSSTLNLGTGNISVYGNNGITWFNSYNITCNEFKMNATLCDVKIKDGFLKITG